MAVFGHWHSTQADGVKRLKALAQPLVMGLVMTQLLMMLLLMMLLLMTVLLGSFRALALGQPDPNDKLPSIEIGPYFQQVPIGQQVQYYHGQLDSSDISAVPLAQLDWQAYDGSQIIMGRGVHSYWFRFSLNNVSDDEVRLLLVSANPLIDRVTLYQRQDGRIINQQVTGDQVSDDKKPLLHEKLLLPIRIEAQQRHDIYLQVEHDGLLDLPLSLVQQSRFIEQYSRNSLWHGILFGFLLATILSSALLFIISRDRSFALFSSMLSLQLLALMTLNGVANRFIWPHWSWLQQHVLSILVTMALIISAFFGLALLRIRKHNIRLLRIIRLLTVAGLVLLFIGLWTPVYWTLAITMSYALIMSIAMFGVGIWAVRHKLAGAGLYAVAAGCSAFVALHGSIWVTSGLMLPLGTFNLFVINVLISTVVLFIALLKLYLGKITAKIAAQQHALADIRSHEKVQQQMLAVEEQAREALETNIQERTFELEVTLRELQEKNRELETLNTQDMLTGVRNRGYFDKKYVAEFRRSRREQSELSLLMLDIDHFKKVNDNYGHLAGDDVIRFVGHILKLMVKRPSDAVCRYGGEEFAIVLPHTDATGALQLAETIRQQIAESAIETSAGPLNVTISCGVCTAIADNVMAQNEYIRLADQALYIAKSQGRNQVVHNQAVNSPIHEEFTVDDDESGPSEVNQ